MKKIFSLLILVLLSSLELFSQQINFSEYKKKYPKSDYVVLENKSDIKYFVEPNSTKLKVKLLFTESILVLTENTDAIELIQVPYSNFEEVTITSAKYFKIDSLNKKILVENVKTKYIESKNYYIENIFYSDLKVKQFACSLPLGERYMVTYTYEKTFNDLKFLDMIELQPQNCNTEFFELTIKTPKINSVDYLIQPVNITYKDFSISESTINNEIVNTIRLSNLKEKKKHKLSPPSNYYLPHFLIITKSYKISDVKHVVLESVNDLYKWYSSLIKELPPVDPEILSLANKITANSKTPEQSIEAIFKWVQNNINYVAFEDGIAGFKPEISINVCTTKYGDCKGMANLLVDLLKSKGFEAYHTWIGTRHLNYDYSFPALCIDNHMICALVLNGKYYFLDATSKTTPWNIPPDHIQGKQALVGKGDIYQIEKVPVTDANLNTIYITADINLLAPTKPIINGDIKYSGELVHNIKAMEIFYGKEDKKNIPNYLAAKKLAFTFNPLVKIITNTENEYSINFKSNSLNNIGISGNSIHLLSDIDRTYYGTSTDTSQMAVYIENPTTITTNIKYTLPLNCSIPIVPEELKFSSSDNLYSMTIKYALINNILTYKKELKINTLFISNTKEWNDFINKVEKSYDQLINIKIN